MNIYKVLCKIISNDKIYTKYVQGDNFKSVEIKITQHLIDEKIALRLNTIEILEIKKLGKLI